MLDPLDDEDGIVFEPVVRPRPGRLASGSKRKTKIDQKAKYWVKRNINMKKQFHLSSVSSEVTTYELPTDAYGEIDFKGATRRAKAKFLRFSDATAPADIFTLMTKHWHLEHPRLLVSVTGGAKNFNLVPKLQQIFSAGLLKVAQIPGAWVITGGTNTGVMQRVGEALQGATKACIGIATWGIVTNKERLCSQQDEELGGKFPYQVSCSLVKKGAYLDHNHTHHLLVDDGTEGKWGGEIGFRSLFEKHIMECTMGKVPAVLLIVEGGIGTIDTLWTAISENSPIAIVIVKDSGRAADVISYAVDNVQEEDEMNVESCSHAGLVDAISTAFPELNEEARKTCYKKIVFCMKRRDSLTVFSMGEESDIDEAILTSLLRVQRTNLFAQLQLTLLWDRADLAQEKIFTQTTQFELNELDLEYAMIMALAMDRVDFVKLLLGYGVCIETILTNDILEFLYAYYSQSNLSTLKLQFHDDKTYVGANVSKYGDVINPLCCYEGFSPQKCAIPRKVIQQTIKSLCKSLMGQGKQEFIEDVGATGGDEATNDKYFTFPYRELFFCAVLNNRHKMAMYLWTFEEGGMSKALIAAHINTELYQHAHMLDLQDDLVKDFFNNAREFGEQALLLLDECYKVDDTKTVQLITTEFNQFKNQTCLALAVASEDLGYVSHSSVQFLLNDLWNGSLKMREITDWQLFLAFFIPSFINGLSFRTKSEKKNMVKTEADKTEADNEDDDVMEEGDGKMPNGRPLELTADSVRKREHKGSLSKAKLLSQDSQYKSYDSMGKSDEKEQQYVYYEKFIEFYFKTPAIKFYANVLSYFVFLIIFAYVCMLTKEGMPTPAEFLLIIYIISLTGAEIYEVSQLDGQTLKSRLRVWSKSHWNRLDACAIVCFFLALALRMHKSTVNIGHLMYAIDAGFWVVRLLSIFFVHRVLGPYVIMIYRMILDTIYFLVILLVFLISYGVSSKAILDPQPPGSGINILSQILFHPYFSMYGELFIDRDPADNATTRFGTPVRNSYAEPFAWVLLGLYLLITNLILMNMLIAIFNNTFNDVQANAAQLWKFERYGLVIEYAQRAPVAPPLNLLVYFYLVIRWLCRKCGTCVKSKTGGNIELTSTVASEDKEELIEFENDCMAMLLRRKELLLEKTTQEASLEILHQVEGMSTAVHSIEERLKKIEIQPQTM